MKRRTIALVFLNLAVTLVLVGGLYDLFVPSNPQHQLDFLGLTAGDLDSRTSILLLALFRALGGCLIAIGLTGLIIINIPLRRHGEHWASLAVLLLVGIAEGINSIQMFRVGSPFWAPLIFIGLLVAGLLVAYVPSAVFRARKE